MIAAAERNDVESVKRLLRDGAGVQARDAQGRTGLMAATYRNHVDVARVLIEAGSDVNAQDAMQNSPLLLAGASGYLDIVRMTLAARPDFTVYNRFGGTALIPACERGPCRGGQGLAQDHDRCEPREPPQLDGPCSRPFS